MIIGRFAKIGADLMVEHFESCEEDANEVILDCPLSFGRTAEGRQRLKRIFALGNDRLECFYSYADALSRIRSLKGKTQGGIDLDGELTGVFGWTYFNRSLVEYFSKDKDVPLPGRGVKDDGWRDGLSSQLSG